MNLHFHVNIAKVRLDPTSTFKMLSKVSVLLLFLLRNW